MVSIQLKPEYTSRTVGDSLYLSLREDILSLRLKPGEELNIKRMAGSLNISRSPVRDALMRLAAESLVDIFPQRGCRVSLIDMRRVRQELFLREGVETLALEQFVPAARESDFERLEEIILRQRQAVHAQDQRKLLEYDEEFHALFFDSTGQSYARRILQNSCAHYRRVRLLSAFYGHIAAGITGEHSLLLQAMRARDVEKCVRLERAHLHRLDMQQLEMEKSRPEYFVPQAVAALL